jgi:hypothetical protein
LGANIPSIQWLEYSVKQNDGKIDKVSTDMDTIKNQLAALLRRVPASPKGKGKAIADDRQNENSSPERPSQGVPPVDIGSSRQFELRQREDDLPRGNDFRHQRDDPIRFHSEDAPYVHPSRFNQDAPFLSRERDSHGPPPSSRGNQYNPDHIHGLRIPELRIPEVRPSGGGQGNRDSYGHQPQFRREATVDTHRFSHTNTSFSRQGENRIKKDDIGRFIPYYEDPDDLGIVADGKDTIYTDVFQFQDRVLSLLENDETRDDNAAQILELFPTLLGGDAIIWWNSELTSDDRKLLRRQGLGDIFNVMRERFKADPAIATSKFTTGSLTLRDLARNENAMNQYVLRKLRYARGMGILNIRNENWHGVMQQVWNTMALDIRQYLRPPMDTETLTSYMQEIAKSKSNLIASAMQKYPFERSRRQAKSSEPSGFARNSYFRNDRYRSNSSYNRDGYNGNRNERRVRFDDQARDDQRDEYRRDQRPERTDRRDDRRPSGGNQRGGQYDRNRDRNDRNRDRNDGKDRAKAYPIDDADRTSGEEADVEYNNLSDSDHSNGSTDHAHFVTTTTFKARRTCRRCGAEQTSRNALFLHLKTCKGDYVADEALVVDTTQAEIEDGPMEIIEEVPPPITDESLRGSFTHMRLTVRPRPGGDVHTVCIDTGTGREMIDKNFLKQFDHVIRLKEGGAIKGFNGPAAHLNEYAEFTFFAQTNNKKLVKLHAAAWVVDKLDANCLIGNAWLHPRKAIVDLGKQTIHFPNIAGGSTLPVDVVKPGRPVVRKVTTSRTVTLKPGESLYLPVDYVALPKGRSFMMSGTHPASVWLPTLQRSH